MNFLRFGIIWIVLLVTLLIVMAFIGCGSDTTELEQPDEILVGEDIWAWNEREIKTRLNELYFENKGHMYMGKYTKKTIALQTEVIILKTLLDVKYSDKLTATWAMITEEATDPTDEEWQ